MLTVALLISLLSCYGFCFLLQDNVGCPDGWTKFNEHCYFYNILRKPWNQAQSTCENFGGHLASIQDIEEDQFIAMFINNSRSIANDWSVNYTWIGATDQYKEGTWVWVTGQPIGADSYSNWRGGGPSNGHHGSHDEDCLDWSGGGWNDNDCATQLSFVCEKALCTCNGVY